MNDRGVLPFFFVPLELTLNRNVIHVRSLSISDKMQGTKRVREQNDWKSVENANVQMSVGNRGRAIRARLACHVKRSGKNVRWVVTRSTVFRLHNYDLFPRYIIIFIYRNVLSMKASAIRW